jgi:U3 small nucleolar RNA-associated protein 13
VKTFPGHISKVTAISFSHNGKFFVSSSRDKVLILWDFENGKQLRTVPVYEGIECVMVLPHHLQLPNGVETSDESKVYVACAGEEGIVKVWQMNDSKMIYKQSSSLISKASEEGGLAITQMLYNEQLQQVALVSFDHNIIVHDLATFSCCKQLIGFTDEILDLVLMGKKDEYLVMATNSNDIKVYDTQTMNSIILKGHSEIVLALASYKNFLLSSGKDFSVRLWEADFEKFTFKCVAIGMKHTKAVGSIDMSKVSGTFFASVSQDQCLKLWKLPKKFEAQEELEKLTCINTQLAHEKDINCVTISPNDRYIATSSQDKTAKLWDSTDLKLMGVFRGHRRGVWSIRFSPVDQIVVTNAADCTIRLWNINDMTCLKSFEGHESSVLRVEFISNGMQLLSAGADGLLKLWTIKSSECVQTLDKHENRVWTIAVTGNEMTFYTGGSDSKLIRWRDVTEIKKREEIKKHQEEVLQEQELNNLLSQKKMLKALRLSLNLNRPYMTLKIINSVVKSQETGLDETIQKLSDDHKLSLLQHAVNWNTNSKNCRPAQLVFDVMMQEILSGKYQVQGLGKIIEESLPYSDRHFKRMTEYLKDLKFVEYTMKCMQPYGDVAMKQ